MGSMLSGSDTDQTEKILRSLERQGYTVDFGRFATGRPDRQTLAVKTRSGLPVVAKLYASGGGQKAYTNMQNLWDSSFGRKRRPPGLPEPVEYLPDLSALIMARLEGRPRL